MIQLNFTIIEQAPSSWTLQVIAGPNDSPRKYTFEKQGFATVTDAKNFLIQNIRLFTVNMGQG